VQLAGVIRTVMMLILANRKWSGRMHLTVPEKLTLQSGISLSVTETEHGTENPVYSPDNGKTVLSPVSLRSAVLYVS